VCAANPDPRFIPPRFFKVMMAGNRTIGIRIPNSAVERQVAAALRSPITTVALRNPDNSSMVDFDDAMEVMRHGMARVGRAWSAIEGAEFDIANSTVVLVTRYSQELDQVRAGAIDFNEIQQTVARARAGGRR
jgi:L-threonylcarbamoyladenylate synthase